MIKKGNYNHKSQAGKAKKKKTRKQLLREENIMSFSPSSIIVINT